VARQTHDAAAASELRIEVGEPAAGMNVRRASILLDGVPIFSEIVYDTDEGGARTEEQARLNITRLFGSRLARLLEDE